MRIAIAGSGGLAQVSAHYINETVHPFIILSRQTRPDLESLGYQETVVNYNNQDDLRFHLRGIDIVISTVSGTPQINVSDAAAHSRVSGNRYPYILHTFYNLKNYQSYELNHY
ncbi:d306c36b-73ba-4e11-8910-cbf856975f29 [Sclerotinia trifoliorum]|uniref:D306c36b-73ba-4e11-8910-cbf856975f29 n=1 Tax=Sclerotinia trifoliorum TaxID=28548 RepID=A0A8H2ZLT9_9HELO|nr:d306c36b-73ba-4e11-8910-cbf856975f29 [Sclerotinia trifoliorum]